MGGLFDALKALLSIILSINFVLRGNPIEEFLLGLVFKQDIEQPPHNDKKKKSATIRQFKQL